MSIARAHFQRTLAEKQAGGKAPAAGTAASGSMAERMAALLAMHKATLKNYQSVAKKIEAKRGFLPEYRPYVAGVLAADSGGQDDVLATLMLWCLDVGAWPAALEIAAYGIRHGLAMPEGLKRDLPTTLVEEIADSALVLCGAQDAAGAGALAGPIQDALELTGESDMPDEVRAKAHKALGLIFKDTAPARAVEHLETALTLDPKSGVKTELTRLRKALDATQAGS